MTLHNESIGTPSLPLEQFQQSQSFLLRIRSSFNSLFHMAGKRRDIRFWLIPALFQEQPQVDGAIPLDAARPRVKMICGFRRDAATNSTLKTYIPVEHPGTGWALAQYFAPIRQKHFPAPRDHTGDAARQAVWSACPTGAHPRHPNPALQSFLSSSNDQQHHPFPPCVKPFPLRVRWRLMQQHCLGQIAQQIGR